jgi:hypothetical protein
MKLPIVLVIVAFLVFRYWQNGEMSDMPDYIPSDPRIKRISAKTKPNFYREVIYNTNQN